MCVFNLVVKVLMIDVVYFFFFILGVRESKIINWIFFLEKKIILCMVGVCIVWMFIFFLKLKNYFEYKLKCVENNMCLNIIF